MKSLLHILLGLLVIFVLYYVMFKSEGFMSPATLDQLSSTSVPTLNKPYLLF